MNEPESMEVIDRYCKQGNGDHSYNEKSVIPISYKEEVLDPLVERARLIFRDPHFVDLAAGKGEAADFFDRFGIRTTRIDICVNALKLQPETKQRIKAKAEQIPLADSCASIAHIKDALVHIPDQAKLFEECFRIVEKNGFLVVASKERGLDPGFYYRRKRRFGRKFKVFDDPEKWLEKIKKAFLNPKIKQNSISPPYFPCSEKDTIKTAQKAGFTLVENTSWTPQKDEKDWYSGQKPRFVLTFQKTA